MLFGANGIFPDIDGFRIIILLFYVPQSNIPITEISLWRMNARCIKSSVQKLWQCNLITTKIPHKVRKWRIDQYNAR